MSVLLTQNVSSSDDNREYEDGVQTIRAKAGTRRGLRHKQSPLERGWSGASPQGKKFGSPVPINSAREYKCHLLLESLLNHSRLFSAVNYDDFESVLIEYKMVSHMTGNFGRVRRLSMLMMTGNKKGLAGFAVTKSPTGRGPHAFQRAVNRAGLKLCSIDLYEGRTVYHDFFTQFGSTRIFVRQKPPGFGVKAHRTIKAACQVIGIQDLEAVIEGAKNYNHIIKAFFLGLLRQRTHQALADEKGLHLVELRAENDNFPRLVASPSSGKVRTKEEILPNEILDFELVK
jgi:small subunit ribosomal protein S5